MFFKHFFRMSESLDVPASFEAAVAELEALIAQMEGGQLPLADALAAYRRGARLLQYCQGALEEARQEVQVLEGEVLRPFVAGVDDNGG